MTEIPAVKKTRNRPLTPAGQRVRDEIQQIHARYLAGEPLRLIAPEYEVHALTLQWHFQQVGLPMLPKGAQHAGRPKSTETRAKIAEARTIQIDLDALRAMAETGQHSTRELGEHFGVHEETIRDRLIAMGISRLPAKARPEQNHFWVGGLTVDKHGYILVKSLDHPARTKAGYVRQHRLVMEQHLGRLLTSGEVVDHRNGDTSDNRIENLDLYPSNSEHLAATLTGLKIPAEEREALRQAAIQRAKQRVAAILAASGTDDPSLP